MARSVLEEDRQGNPQVNCINYEICVLTALRERLRCKEIWVAGAEATGTPMKTCRGISRTRRAEYYRELGRDADARAFIAGLKTRLSEALTRLNRTIPRQSEGPHPVARQEPDLDHARSRRFRRRLRRMRFRRSSSAAGR